MPELSTFRSIIEERRTKITPSDPITTTENYIKYVQPWPVNTEKEDKEKDDDADKPPTKKQKQEHLHDQAAAKEAFKSLISTDQSSFSMDKYLSLPLIRKKDITSDTRVYTFKHNLKSVSSFNLGIGQHVLCGFMMNDGIVERPYAITRPTGSDEDDGTIDVLVKVAYPNSDGKDPGGLLSNIIDCLSIERKDELLFRGPEGPIIYNGNGKFTICSEESSIDESIKKAETEAGKKEKKEKSVQVTAKKVNFISGGSGMTPIFATIKSILESANDHTQVCFLDCNPNQSEILLNDELNSLAKSHEAQFKLVHVLDKPSDDWDGEKGKPNKEIMERNLFMPSDKDGKNNTDVVSLVCGPPPMIDAVKGDLEKLGFVNNKTFFHY